MTVLADDYRDLEGTFDKIIAIEMIEAVDWREYDTFFAHCRRLLDEPAHWQCRRSSCATRASIASSSTPTSSRPPSSPVAACLGASAHRGRKRQRVLAAHEDDIGLHYGETLRRWRRNLTDARDDLDTLGLDERFVRLWKFYFSYCEAAFEERYLRDVQLLYTAPAWRPSALRDAPTAEAAHHGWDPSWCGRDGHERGRGHKPDLTLQEAADLLGVHYMTAYRYVRTGRLPGRRVGAHWHVRHADLDTVAATAPAGRNAVTRRVPKKDYVRRLASQLVQGDEAEAWRLLQAALGSAYSPEDLYFDVLGPAMRPSATTGQPAASTSPTSTARPS